MPCWNSLAGIRVSLTADRDQPTGRPITSVPKNGSEFISMDLDLWALGKGVTLDFSRPGKPTDNAFVESFNGKVRAKCIDQNWFLSLDDAR